MSQVEDNQEVTAVYTTQENIYTGTSMGPHWGEQLIQTLKEHGDTQVTHLVTMVRSGTAGGEVRKGLDIPPYNLRKMLIELNEKNEFALCVIQGHECLRTHAIGKK